MVDKITDSKLKIIGLYKSNYAVQYHVREMGKLLQKSHVTLLPHLKALEKDKVLVPKTIGKNKSYVLNLDNLITKSYILLAEAFYFINYLDNLFLIKKITTELFSLNLPGTFILFGSYARAAFSEESDIDLFYLGEIKEDQANKIKAIGRTYGKTINVKKATLKNFEMGLRKKDHLIVEVVKNHIILQNSEQFISALWNYYHES